MIYNETSEPIAQQWRIEKFRERVGKPLFKGVFQDASMLSIEASCESVLKQGLPKTASKD